MAATFDNLGLQFLYPENWVISEQSQGEMYSASVTLQSTGSACWTVHRYPSSCPQQQLVEELVTAMQKEYPQAEDKEFEELEEVFMALSTSVLGHATSADRKTS